MLKNVQKDDSWRSTSVQISHVEVVTAKVVRLPPRISQPLWNICVANDHGYVPFVIPIHKDKFH